VIFKSDYTVFNLLFDALSNDDGVVSLSISENAVLELSVKNATTK